MRKVSRFILLLTLFIGCNDVKIKRNIQQLQAIAISLPQHGVITIQGRDTLLPEFMQGKLKLVVYIDSVNCSSCVISKMYLWDDFIENAKLYQERLKYYYIFSPRKQDVNKVRSALNRIAISYDHRYFGRI